MDERVNGREITLFLNKLRKKSYDFTHFYQQTEQENLRFRIHYCEFAVSVFKRRRFFTKAATGSIRCTIC